uniref:Klotho beta n=1 Tax=Acanthochromis polyacanthus TaxID=80966 RepID=A0A3Q1FEH1_9TELE
MSPQRFLWGSGTSAYQTEGAWNQDGKGPSIWDSFTHSVTEKLDRMTANVASDSYNRWEEDVKALEYLSVRSYSFSLSWPRLFPDGNARAIKFDGVQVFGYSAWSLVDGFEWNYDYTIRRGLFYVDFSQQDRTRTPKTSAQYYRQVVADNGFPSEETSREFTGHFPCEFHWGIADSTLQVR